MLFEEEAKKIIARGDVEYVRECLVARMDKAGLEYLSEGRNKIFEMFVEIADNFDGSEYQQGKKDGLRIALALLGKPEMADFNRGGRMARERP